MSQQPSTASPTCKLHSRPFTLLCTTCKSLLCSACKSAHACKLPSAAELSAYAAEVLLPRLKSGLLELNVRCHAAKELVPGVKKSLGLLRTRLAKLLHGLDAEALLDSCEFGQETQKRREEKRLAELQSAIAGKDYVYLAAATTAVQSPKETASPGPAEMREAAGIAEKMLGETESLMDILRKLVAPRHELMPPVVGGALYGICGPAGEYTKLCRYDIADQRLVQCLSVPQCCAVVQVANRVFISGGYASDTISAATSEFLTIAQSLSMKSPMSHPKFNHTAVALSSTTFATVGGFDQSGVTPHCEEYHAESDTWTALPPLSQPRCYAAATRCGSYLYTIGGQNAQDIIERLSMPEKKQWETVPVKTTEVSLSSRSAAFPRSETEVMLLVGNNTTEAAIFDTKAGTVRRHPYTMKPDKYYSNSVCWVEGDVYVIGGGNGHVHIYRTATGRFEEVDYSQAVVHG